MGTRSTIQFNSKELELSIVIYKHWDGCPSDNLNMLLEALKKSDSLESLIDQCAVYYTTDYDIKRGEPRTFDSMCDYVGPYQSDLYNTHQTDLEYCYLVDFDAKSIDIYGTGYGDQSEHYNAGRVSPYKELDSYYEEARPRYKTYINDSLLGLASLGWIVNKVNKNNKAAA